jgi:hypothetical protein
MLRPEGTSARGPDRLAAKAMAAQRRAWCWQRRGRRDCACRQGREGRGGPRVEARPRDSHSPMWLPWDLGVRALGQRRG